MGRGKPGTERRFKKATKQGNIWLESQLGNLVVLDSESHWSNTLTSSQLKTTLQKLAVALLTALLNEKAVHS